jgi:hypothetical protein
MMTATLSCRGSDGPIAAAPLLATQIAAPMDLSSARITIVFVPVSACAGSLAPIVTALRRAQSSFPDITFYTALPVEARMDPAFVVGKIVASSPRDWSAGGQQTGTLIVYDHEGRLLLWRLLSKSALEEERVFTEIRASYSLTRPRRLS